MKKKVPYAHVLYEKMQSNANSEYAPAMEKYMKNHFAFLGIKAPSVKRIFKDFIKENGLPEYKELHGIVRELWELPEREMQYCAIELVVKLKKEWDDTILEMAEEMIINKSWWDATDSISSGIIGQYLVNQPEKKRRQYAHHLMQSENMWLQRTAIIFQRGYKNKTDEELLFSLCLTMADSKEFFIRKGIGWALREYAYRQPEKVRQFVLSHSFTTLTQREALKHIGKG